MSKHTVTIPWAIVLRLIPAMLTRFVRVPAGRHDRGITQTGNRPVELAWIGSE